jgi:hypothetical protein
MGADVRTRAARAPVNGSAAPTAPAAPNFKTVLRSTADVIRVAVIADVPLCLSCETPVVVVSNIRFFEYVNCT